MSHRFRLIRLAPRSAAWPALTTVCVAFVLPWFYLALWRMGIPPDQTGSEITRGFLLVVMTCAALYGSSRALCHPILSPRYLRWLATTPWQPPMPLPMDPVHPIWRDGLWTAILAAMTVFLAHRHPTLTMIAMLGGYLLVLGEVLFLTKQWVSLTAVLTLVPVILYVWGRWSLLLALLAAMSVIALHGIRTAWRTFPWGAHERLTESKIRPWRLGWPFDRLNARDPQKLLSRRIVVVLPFLVGWYVFSACELDEKFHDPKVVAYLIAVLGCAVGLIRFGIYCQGQAPPMGFFARIRTGNFLLPGYDRILVAPLAVAMTAVLGAVALDCQRIYPPLMAGIMTTVLLTLALGLPPTLRRWQLTGQYRMLVVKPRVSKG